MERSRPRWAVVLAGGEGERLRPTVEAWLGSHRPKQYCCFTGERSMLQHTVDRALEVVGSPDRIVLVIGRDHRRHLPAALDPGKIGHLIEQPKNLGTGTAILVAASYILGLDSRAVVWILPSDHFVYPEERFQGYLERSADLATCSERKLVVLAVEPDRPEPEFGWIEPGPPVGCDRKTNGWEVSGVSSFQEKPSPLQSRLFYEAGYLVNTMIVTVEAARLVEFGRSLSPRFGWVLELAERTFSRGRSGSRPRLDMLYEEIPSSDFSRDFLEPGARDVAVLPMRGVDWSDWGRAPRITESLRKLGKRPFFEKQASSHPLFPH